MVKPKVQKIQDEADFEAMSWHDNPFYGFAIDIGKEQGNLVLDIDHIVEWVGGDAESARFWIAPATLVFKDVTDLTLELASGNGRFQTGLSEMVILEIQRQRIAEQLVCLDRRYYKWTIDISLPGPAGKMEFGASGFVQTLRGDPVLCDKQHLPFDKRVPMAKPYMSDEGPR